MPRNLMPIHAGPAAGARAVTPHDTNELAEGNCRALYVGTGGDVTVEMADGDEITFVGVANAQILPIQARIVLATGTTASDIVALY